MVLQCLGAFAPFLLITFGPYLAVRIFIRPTPLRTLALWAWRTWFVGLVLLIVLIVGGALGTTQGTAVAQNFYSGSAGNSQIEKNSAVARLSASGAAPAEFLQIIYRVAGDMGNSVEPELVMGIITQESAWNAAATSYSGAMGLMQLMPGTAADMGVSSPYDPEQNIRGGMKYIALLLNRYNGDYRQAVMAYHAGPGDLESRGPTSLDLYYADKVLGYYDDYRARTSMGLLLPFGLGSQAQAIGPLYEYATLTQGLHENDAIDVSGSEGAALYSPISGEITGRFMDGLGNTVLVIENDYWKIVLLHGDYLAKLGDQVQQGDLIGFEANNGNTWSNGMACYGRDGCGDHSHISIFSKQQGRQVNPLQYQIAKRGM